MAHEFVLGFADFSGSGKTTLLERLVARFAPERRIGYFKHDAHAFAMDREGKDTWRLKRAGAARIAIQSATEWAQLGDCPGGPDLSALDPDPDWWFVEGFKDAGLERLVLLDAEGRMDAKLTEQGTQGIVALVAPDPSRVERAGVWGLPVFHRDDLDGIAACVDATMRRRIAPLNGLVLLGGRSRRMGQDKAEMTYHGKPQYIHAAGLLAKVCDSVLLSVRPDQDVPGSDGLVRVPDRFVGFGPLGGILSAFEHDRKSAWLVLACDMPMLTDENMKALVSGRDPWRVATAMRDPDKSFPEPLAAIWEPKARGVLLDQLRRDIRCPRRALERNRIAQVEVPPAQLANANDPLERERLLSLLQGGCP